MTKFTKKDLMPYIKLYMLKGMEEGIWFEGELVKDYLIAVRCGIDWSTLEKNDWALICPNGWQFTEKFYEDIIEGKYFDT